jgi:hypothetical protein
MQADLAQDETGFAPTLENGELIVAFPITAIGWTKPEA